MNKPGEFLPGGWEIICKLGEGSYGMVYHVSRTIGGFTEHAAVKYISIPRNEGELEAIRSEVGQGEGELTAYLEDVKNGLVNEYGKMKQLQGHTNIVACSDIQIIEKHDAPGFDMYIWMEMLTSLSSRVVDGSMNRDEVLRMGMDICNALALLEDKGIVHRDIKPQNIFVNEEGNYKLGDFGAAKTIKGTSSLMSARGTYAFMAPEIMLGKPADCTSDLYSLGLVLYRLMNGNKSPFMLPGQASTSSTLDAANTRRFSGEPLPSPIHADVELSKIILKACAFEPRDRWQHASDLYDALAELAGGTVKRRDLGTMMPPAAPVDQGDAPNADQQKDERPHQLEQMPGAGLHMVPAGKKGSALTYGLLAVAVMLLIILILVLTMGRQPVQTAGTPVPDLPVVTPLPTATPQPIQTGVKAGDYTISIFADGSCEITGWDQPKAQEVKIPGKLNGHRVVSIGEKAFAKHENLRAVTIPQGVIHICMWAFGECRQLKKVTIPASVSVISKYGAFAYCDLTEIKMDDANPYYYVKDRVLYSRDGTLMAYPAGLAEEAYIVPDHVIRIGDYAFCGSRIRELVIPEGVQSIESRAFVQCEELVKLQLPASVTYIDPTAFMLTKKLQEIHVAVDNPVYYSIQHESSSGQDFVTVDVLFNRNGMLMYYPAGSRDWKYSIPEGITSIAPYAFFEANLERVIIPASVVSIGRNPFIDSNSNVNMTLVVLPGSYAHTWAIENGADHVVLP